MAKLMMHLVAGYPDIKSNKSSIDGFVENSVDSLEIQIPFSDPIADGPVLMRANDEAISRNIGTSQTLALAEFASKKLDTYIMTYLQPIVSYGPDKFFDQAIKSGCAGFIIPDLPFDAPEINRFVESFPVLKQMLVPVLSEGMHESRLTDLFTHLEPKTIYLTARFGITGDKTGEFSSELKNFINMVKSYTDAKIAIGFGIQTGEDVRRALEFADLAVVGSAYNKALAKSNSNAGNLLKELVAAAK